MTCRIDYKMCTICLKCIHVKCSSSHAQNTLQPYLQLVKLSIMTIGIKTKVLIIYGTSGIICVELIAKKL